ncbi:MAG: hypothetical protein NC206_00235 [Bacteroides sp.]|nr:hypothetical protein [Roseburia sp.]MCM1345503.1 hypothetical protein [Bacteroides sp.]MCM1420012.1 hypothetical protein [Bacteroides sp.]
MTKKLSRLFAGCCCLAALIPVTAFADTKSKDTECNEIKIAENAPKVKYNPMIFGQFIEHFHTQIYGSIYDPKSKFADEDGFKADVIKALKEIKTPS